MLLSDTSIIQQALPAGLTLFGLGLVFAIVLLVASIRLKVEVDPKVEQVQNVLPGIDCGACGFAGCASYAEAVVADPELIGKCAPGGAQCSEDIAKVLNLQVSAGGYPQRPIVHCHAKKENKTFYAQYEGIPSCTSANAVANVQACKWGCLGFGDCVRACKFDALHIVDGLATVDYEKCTGCTACAKACPRNLIEMVPFSQDDMMTVACNSKENGKTTRGMCKVGCIGCGMCVKFGGEVFELENNLARVNYECFAENDQTKTAMEKCPTKVIIHRGKTADKTETVEV